MNAPKPKAYSYARMSTKAQADRGKSLERQLAEARKYALNNDLDLQEVDEFKDLGLSAYTGANVKEGALGKILGLAMAGAFDPGSYLIVESFDRFSREHPDIAFGNFLALIQAGLVIVTLSPDEKVYRKGGDTIDLMRSLIEMERAHKESERKSDVVSKGWKKKIDGAKTARVTSIAPAWLIPNDKNSFDLAEEKVRIVRRIFDEYANGLGTNKIAQRLNSSDVAPIGRGATWQPSYLKKILSNRAVLGEYQPMRRVNGNRLPYGMPVQGYFPAIIDTPLFEKVQHIRRSRGKSSGGRRGKSVANVFGKTRMRCADCLGPVHFINKGTPPKGGRYYVCDRGRRGLACTRTHWPVRLFERAIIPLIVDPEHLDAESRVPAPKDEKRRTKLEKELSDAKQALADHERVWNAVQNKSSDLFDERVRLQDRLGLAEKSVREFIPEPPKITRPVWLRPDLIDPFIESLFEAPEDDREKLRAKVAKDIEFNVQCIFVSFDGLAALLGPESKLYCISQFTKAEMELALNPQDPDHNAGAVAIFYKANGIGNAVQPMRSNLSHTRIEFEVATPFYWGEIPVSKPIVSTAPQFLSMPEQTKEFGILDD